MDEPRERALRLLEQAIYPSDIATRFNEEGVQRDGAAHMWTRSDIIALTRPPTSVDATETLAALPEPELAAERPRDTAPTAAPVTQGRFRYRTGLRVLIGIAVGLVVAVSAGLAQYYFTQNPLRYLIPAIGAALWVTIVRRR